MVEQLLLALKVAFVVLLYLFVWRVIRVASSDIAVGQESMVLTPAKRPEPMGMLPAAMPGSPTARMGTWSRI